jgi:hypothetical protein
MKVSVAYITETVGELLPDGCKVTMLTESMLLSARLDCWGELLTALVLAISTELLV